MKTFLRFLALSAALAFAAAPAHAQHAIKVDTSGNPTTTLNLSGGNITGTLPAGRLAATVVQTTGDFTLGGTFTFSVAPVFTDAAGTRAALGLAAVASTGAASDLSGLATIATSGALSDGTGLLLDAQLPADAVVLSGGYAVQTGTGSGLSASYADSAGSTSYATEAASATALDDGGAAIIAAVGFSSSGYYSGMSVGSSDYATNAGSTASADVASSLDDSYLTVSLEPTIIAAVGFDPSAYYSSMSVGNADYVVRASSADGAEVANALSGTYGVATGTGTLTISTETAPGSITTPSTGVTLYVSSTDHKLHAKDAGGTDHALW